jgi:hypothetical protein
MKRIVILLALTMLLPLNAFALQPLSQNDMGSIAAQAGVSIAIDDVKLYQNIGYLTYTDADGTTNTFAGITDPGSGSISISNLYMMVNINAITSLDANGMPVSPGRAIQGTWGAGTTPYFNYNNAGGDTVFQAKPLTIDVGTLNVLSAGLANNNTVLGLGLPSTTVAGVQIGLPTMEITQTALTFDITTNYTGAVNDGASYGKISIGNNTLGILDGVVEIAPH